MADTTIDRSAPTRLKRRRPWLAALLSLFALGLGLLYNGRLRAAILWFAAELLLFLIMMAILASGLTRTFGGLIVAILLPIGIRLAAVVQAFIAARRVGTVAL